MKENRPQQRQPPPVLRPETNSWIGILSMDYLRRLAFLNYARPPLAPLRRLAVSLYMHRTLVRRCVSIPIPAFPFVYYCSFPLRFRCCWSSCCYMYVESIPERRKPSGPFR